MKKILTAIALAVGITGASFASSLDVSALSQAQVDQLKTQVREMEKPPSTSKVIRSEAAEWGELGANMGRAMISAAREVGVAANEFANTPLGKVTVALVVYKMVGKQILEVITGAFILLVGTSLSLWFLLSRRWEEVKYEYRPVLWGLFNRKYVVSSIIDEDVVVPKLIAAGLVAVVTLAVGLAVMF